MGAILVTATARIRPARATTYIRCKLVEEEGTALTVIRTASATARKISGSRINIKAVVVRKTSASTPRLFRHLSAHRQHAASRSRPEIAKLSTRMKDGHKMTSGLKSNRLSAKSNNDFHRNWPVDVQMATNRRKPDDAPSSTTWAK